MQKRKLGISSLEVAPLTLGGNVFGWTIDEKKSFEILDAFIAAGFNLVDTANVYSRLGNGPYRWRIRNYHWKLDETTRKS